MTKKTNRKKKINKTNKKNKTKKRKIIRSRVKKKKDSLPDRNTLIRNKTSLIERLKNKNRIVDVTFSVKKSKGTNASIGDFNFHYQNYNNIMDFLKTLGNIDACFFGNQIEFLEINVDKKKMIIKVMNINNPWVLGDKSVFIGNLIRCLKQTQYNFIPIILNIKMKKGDNHANIMLINSREKTIELYEPHGSRTSQSELGDITGAYNKKFRTLKKFWRDILPGYSVINAVDYRSGTHFQMEYDPERNSGFCVTWSILFAHYRLLNPRVDLDSLMKYLSLKITTTKLLQYAKYIEDTIKHKI